MLGACLCVSQENCLVGSDRRQVFDCQGQTAVVAKGYQNVAFLRKGKAFLASCFQKCHTEKIPEFVLKGSCGDYLYIAFGGF